MAAIKFNEDEFFKNDFYAKVGGLQLKELNALEMEFLVLMEFKFYVDESLYLSYAGKLRLND